MLNFTIKKKANIQKEKFYFLLLKGFISIKKLLLINSVSNKFVVQTLYLKNFLHSSLTIIQIKYKLELRALIVTLTKSLILVLQKFTIFLLKRSY